MTALVVTPEAASHQVAIDRLHDLVFGPGRFVRTAYRVRGRHGHDRDLSFVAMIGDRVAGACWQTRVVVGSTPSVLLGPLAVDPEFEGRGFGVALLKASLDAARFAGAPSVLLVGDAPYYARVGFEPIKHQRIGWPGPVDPARVLGVEFQPGAIARLAGPIRAARWGAANDLSALPVPGEAQAAE